MKIIVTGGAGFIGSNLVDRLVAEHDVLVLDNLSTGKRRYVNRGAMFKRVDLSDWKSTVMYFQTFKPDYVFHLAALPRVQRSVEYPLLTHNSNVNSTVNVLEMSRLTKVKRVIFASSSSIYGDFRPPHREDMPPKPLSPYALHKLIGEQYCKIYSETFKLDTVSLRFFNVYGDRQPEDSLVMGIFEKQSECGGVCTIYGTGEQTRDFTHVDDIVEGLVRSMEYSGKFNGEVINLGTGRETSINDLAKKVGCKYINYVKPRRYDGGHKAAHLEKAHRILNWYPSRYL